MAAGQRWDLAFPRCAVDFLFPLLASLSVIRTCTAMFIKKKELLQEGIWIISFLPVLQILLKSDLRNLQSGYCTFLGGGGGIGASSSSALKQWIEEVKNTFNSCTSVTFQKRSRIGPYNWGWLFSLTFSPSDFTELVTSLLPFCSPSPSN